jgi:hypothetical protein
VTFPTRTFQFLWIGCSVILFVPFGCWQNVVNRWIWNLVSHCHQTGGKGACDLCFGLFLNDRFSPWWIDKLSQTTGDYLKLVERKSNFVCLTHKLYSELVNYSGCWKLCAQMGTSTNS